MKLTLAFLLALVVGNAAAAELPSRHAEPTEAAKTCRINGREGVMLPGTDTCLRVGGGVSATAAFGAGQSQSRQKSAP